MKTPRMLAYLIFYTGKTRKNSKILSEQNDKTRKDKSHVIEALDYIKKSGYEILEMFENGDISRLGEMFHNHWQYKKKLKISDDGLKDFKK